MKCPNCEYEGRRQGLGKWWRVWEPETKVEARRSDGYEEEKADIYACPKCKILFVDA